MRIFGIAAAVIALGWALAAPASADPSVVGSYDVVNSPEVWTVTSCGADCVDVASNTGPNRHLHLNDGRWVSTPYVGSVHCPVDNSEATTEMVTTVDANFTGYTDNMLKVIGTCRDGYSFIGQTIDVSGELIKRP